jgi:hypothetical protein
LEATPLLNRLAKSIARAFGALEDSLVRSSDLVARENFTTTARRGCPVDLRSRVPGGVGILSLPLNSVSLSSSCGAFLLSGARSEKVPRRRYLGDCPRYSAVRPRLLMATSRHTKRVVAVPRRSSSACIVIGFTMHPSKSDIQLLPFKSTCLVRATMRVFCACALRRSSQQTSRPSATLCRTAASSLFTVKTFA